MFLLESFLVAVIDVNISLVLCINYLWSKILRDTGIGTGPGKLLLLAIQCMFWAAIGNHIVNMYGMFP